MTSALLLSIAVAVLLSGCGTFSALLKSDGTDARVRPAVPAATVVAAVATDVAATEVEQAAAVPKPGVPPPSAAEAAGTTLAPPVEEREAQLPLRRSDDEEESPGAALAQKAADADQFEEDYDPWESFNEKMFTVNRNLDKYVLKPAARVYRVIMPEPWQVLIANGFDNINFVPRMVNSLLQGKWGGAGREISRFLINSTAGIGGLFDPAKDYWGIQKSREDFGQTLGVWGAGSGPYLVLPLLEPLTVRDGIGKAVDGFMDPLGYFLPFFWDRIGMKAGDTLNDRALNYDLFQGFEESVIDMYSAVRHGYIQRRRQLIKE
jgi:phospholipid-binding lipoprotein MlaA